jgi:hypothetical protein
VKFVGLPKKIQSKTAFLEIYSKNADVQNIKIAFKKTSTMLWYINAKWNSIYIKMVTQDEIYEMYKKEREVAKV